MWPRGSRPKPNGARLQSQELAVGSLPILVLPCHILPVSFKHIPSDAVARINLEKKPRRDVGLPAPLSRCALVCSRSSPLLLLCAQTFPCVPRLLLVCSSCLNGCPCVPTSNSQHKDSHLALVGKQWGREQLSSSDCAGISQRCLLGILWVTCKCSLGCLPCDRAFGPRPCWDPRGSELLPCAGAFLTRGDSVTPVQSRNPHRTGISTMSQCH